MVGKSRKTKRRIEDDELTEKVLDVWAKQNNWKDWREFIYSEQFKGMPNPRAFIKITEQLIKKELLEEIEKRFQFNPDLKSSYLIHKKDWEEFKKKVKA